MVKIIEFSYGIYKEVFDRIKYISEKTVPVNYYARHNNWGDQLNAYLVEKITGKKVVKVNFKCFRHLLAIGSVLSSASPQSIIWGSGFISKTATIRFNSLDIRAVRGIYTRNRLVNEYSIECPNIFGDPAVLLPMFYEPKVKVQKGVIGVIPHYKDKELPLIKHMVENGCRLIDIQDDIETFINSVCECEYILSSSLHGLIAADTYGISNQWVSFSDNIIGGEFKFLDYYSTTENENPKVLSLSIDTLDFSYLINSCSVNKFSMDKVKLLDSFPQEFLS